MNKETVLYLCYELSLLLSHNAIILIYVYALNLSTQIKSQQKKCEETWLLFIDELLHRQCNYIANQTNRWMDCMLDKRELVNGW